MSPRGRDSDSNPIYLASVVPPGASGGWAGITFAPGKKAPGSYASWDRDLDKDLARLCDLGATTLVPLLTDDELALLHIPTLAQKAREHGLEVRRFPYHDGGVPPDRTAFRLFVAELVTRLERGEHLVIHCRGGLGRAGTVAACLRLALGLSPDARSAIADVRRVRRGALETPAQERFVADFAAGR